VLDTARQHNAAKHVIYLHES